MNKQELIEATAGKANLTKVDAGRAVEAVFEAITEALKKNDPVTLIGFGTFRVSQRKARTGRSPRTGQPIQIAATKAARFTPGKFLKTEINSVK